MYVVAAVDHRVGPPPIREHGDRHQRPPTLEPVGIQHAVPQHAAAGESCRALCGADVKDWVHFGDRPFLASSGATCQRCSQLAVTSETQPEARR